jgi:hypothetical protein
MFSLARVRVCCTLCTYVSFAELLHDLLHLHHIDIIAERVETRLELSRLELTILCTHHTKDTDHKTYDNPGSCVV